MADLKKDMEQIAHDIKNTVTQHDDHEDVKKALSHEDKATEFTQSVGISSDGTALHCIPNERLSGARLRLSGGDRSRNSLDRALAVYHANARYRYRRRRRPSSRRRPSPPD